MAVNLNSPFNITNPANASAGPGAYSDNMWYNITELKQPIVQMMLMERFKLLSVWRPFVPTQLAFNHPNGALAEEMTFKGIYSMEPNTAPVGTRQIWFGSNYTDTYSQKVVFEHYADKVAIHEYDDKINYFRRNGQSEAGMLPIVRDLLAESVTTALDILARNAHFETPRSHWISGGTVNHGETPDFSGITETDVFDLNLGRDVWESLAYEDIPFAANPNGASGMLYCLTTPSMVKQVKNAAGSEWRSVNQYANPEMLLRYEVGTWDNTRFLQSRRNVLWNCGSIKRQAPVTQTFHPGDGAYDGLVDKVYSVGQKTGVVNGITVNNDNAVATGAGDFAVNDVVTIHKARTLDSSDPDWRGIANGVNMNDPEAFIRRIVAIDASTPTSTILYFDKPIFKEIDATWFATKAVHIHTSTYIGGPAVANGVGDPIHVLAHPPQDDAGAIWRFVWLGRFKYQLINPSYAHVVYHGATPPMFGIGTAP